MDDVSALDAGTLRVLREPVALRTVVQEALELIGGRAVHRCHTDVDDTVVEGDSDRLVMVVSNLIGNAFKHSPPGSSVSVRGVTAGDTAVLHVMDDVPASSGRRGGLRRGAPPRGRSGGGATHSASPEGMTSSSGSRSTTGEGSITARVGMTLSMPDHLDHPSRAPIADAAEWREMLEALPQIVWVTRPDGYHVFFNQPWMDFTGLTLSESLGDGWNPPFHPDDRPLARRLWEEATRTGEPYEIEYRLRRHDGVYHWMLGRALPLRGENGEIVKWFGTCTDIQELRTALDDAAELRRELERRATHDPLTGLANRTLLMEQMESVLRGRRRSGMAVVFIDLDGFKGVNDRFGHGAGDQLLVDVADRLRAAVRQGDTAARIGGDEFVVVGEADDPQDAEDFGQRIAGAVCGRLHLEGEAVAVEASVGVSFVENGDGATAEVALALADARMYEAKRRP